MTLETRELCVLFADVVGSTRLYEKLGDAEALHAIERCLNRMERATVSFGGKVLKTIGDEILCVFDTPELAMHAACEMQVRVDDLPRIANDKLSIRIGFHFGSTLLDGGDVYGETVNTAAHIANIAKGRQIITSKATADRLPGGLRRTVTRPLPPLPLKGKQEAIPIVDVIWQHSDAMTMTTLSSLTPSLTGPATLLLRYHDQEMLLEGDKLTLTIGRDATNDLVIADPRASRAHGRIEYRQDRYVVIDQSSNGTFVNIVGEKPFALRREEAILHGKGYICLGHVCRDGSSEFALYFEVIG